VPRSPAAGAVLRESLARRPAQKPRRNRSAGPCPVPRPPEPRSGPADLTSPRPAEKPKTKASPRAVGTARP
jgi:hypothetical protein